MITIDKALSRTIANIGFICSCLIVGLHVPIHCVAGSWQAAALHRIMFVLNMAVPIFFIISGFLFAGHIGENGWWGRAVRSRLKSLLIPYIIWNWLSLLFAFALTHLATLAGTTFGDGQWAQLGVQRFILALGMTPPWFPELVFLWYVRALIIFALIAPFFALARYRILGLIVILSVSAFYFVLPQLLSPADDWSVHFMKISLIKGALFFSIGIYLRWNGICFGSFGRMVAKLMCLDGSWFKMLTGAAFPIFLIHHFVIMIFIAAFRIAGVKEMMAGSLAAYIVQWIFVVIVCVLLTKLIRQVCPKVAMVIFGWR